MTSVAPRTAPFAETLLFPAAAVWGALAVPLSLHSMAGGPYAFAGFATAGGHAHELLFGYAMAVVAGFLINRVDARRLAALLALWVAGRVAHLLDPGSVASVACNVGFAAWVAAVAAPPYLKGAKKWRNRVIGPLIAALALACAALEWALATQSRWLSFTVLEQCVLLFALLLMFFGGRTIAPAVAGAIVRAGGQLDARVQPIIEGALIVLLLAALPASLLTEARAWSGAALGAAGGLVLVRLVRWQIWRCVARIDLLCLGVGYGWLGVGLLLIGATRWPGAGLNPAAAMHAVTIGALGTLTANMMLRTRRLHLRRDPSMPVACVLLTAAMSAAALLRVVGDADPLALRVGAACWSTALLGLCVLLIGLRRRPERAAGRGP